MTQHYTPKDDPVEDWEEFCRFRGSFSPVIKGAFFVWRGLPREIQQQAINDAIYCQNFEEAVAELQAKIRNLKP